MMCSKELLNFQGNEITEHEIYVRLSSRAKGRNREVLRSIAEDELKHYEFLRKLTGVDVKPNKLKIALCTLLSFLFGFTFTVKLMERSEEKAQSSYAELAERSEEFKRIIEEEFDHESKLTEMIREERVEYVGSIILGLNDALIELTGSLIGFSMALLNAKYVVAAGLIAGVAASLSMSASEYLSRKSEMRGSPFKGALYTGVAYLITVMLLVMPFLLTEEIQTARISMLLIASLIICIFSSYLAVIRGRSLLRSISEMLLISLGVAGVSYFLGVAAKLLLGLEI